MYHSFCCMAGLEILPGVGECITSTGPASLRFWPDWGTYWAVVDLDAAGRLEGVGEDGI